MVYLKNLTYRYPRGESDVLHDINLTIQEGQFFALIGPNGAGKSTLCYVLTGFVPHFYKGKLSGTVTINGRDVFDTPLPELAGVTGLVFATPFNQISGARFTVREEIAFGLENFALPREEIIDRTEKVMKLFNLTDLAERPPTALSGGQQQRLALASIIVMRPRLLVLDEPTSQLDPVSTHEVFSALDSLINQEHLTVVLVSHKLEWVAAFADRVAILDQGQIAADGPPEEILTSAELTIHGLTPTQFTAVSLMAQRTGLIDSKKALPVTLDQAVQFFK
ncbi:MAG: energy-coupling factor ABC transporter ATP-binding protein [Anaerolineae bacterium]|nr:energy-coupling factor ABC transporter ATP-binding protein [Anaerolineae bacterium]